MFMDTERTLPCGNLELSPIRITTVTRDGRKAVVFAETERRYFGVYYTGDVYGWCEATWYKPSGNFKSERNSAVDLNLTSKGVEIE